MNLILLFNEDFISNNRVRLTGRREDHLRSVLKVQVGSALTVGKCNGPVGKGIIMDMNAGVELEVSFDCKPTAALGLILILALPRPHLLKRSLFFAAMLGIKHIHLLNFNRVEKSLWNSSSLRPEIINEHLVLGLEQAKDTIMPQVTLHPQFKPFVEDQLPTLIQDTMAIVAHPDGKEFYSKKITKPITLVIGPEGGIIPYENELFASKGFVNVGFGPRILRVDAAIPFIISKLF